QLVPRVIVARSPRSIAGSAPSRGPAMTDRSRPERAEPEGRGGRVIAVFEPLEVQDGPVTHGHAGCMPAPEPSLERVCHLGGDRAEAEVDAIPADERLPV